MSYDIYFVRRDPGQTFEDALESLEDSYQGDPGPLSDVDLEQWERLLPRARAILGGDVEEFGNDTKLELSDDVTGIQLSLVSGEMSITVPYWHGDEEAVSVMGKVYALARAVEDETGLEGYDPQLEEPVTEVREPMPWTRRAARADADDEEASGGAGGAPRTAQPPEPQPAQGDRPRRWWEFWRR